MYRENRYLLFLTENYEALQVLKHKLHESIVSVTSSDVPLDSSIRSSSLPPDSSIRSSSLPPDSSIGSNTVPPDNSIGSSSVPPDSSIQSSTVTNSLRVVHRTKEPYVLFGSSFPQDKEYTQVCRNINQIKICMETGRTIILLNLENLYESLYDLLNQYYVKLGNTRYIDLGLQTHRVKCRVDNNFK